MRTPAGFSVVRITSIYPFPGRSPDCALGAFPCVELPGIYLLGTRAHRSNSQCQRIHLRHLPCTAHTCSAPSQGTKLWDSLVLPYCCQSPRQANRGLSLFTSFAGKKESRRADSNRFTAHYECAVRRCRDLQGIANAAYLEGFLFPGLLRVAPYCVPGGLRLVSISPSYPPST